MYQKEDQFVILSTRKIKKMNMKIPRLKMNTVKLFLILLAAIAYQSCASDAYRDLELPIDTGNGIHYQGVFYPLSSLIIKKKEFTTWNNEPGIDISLSSSDDLFNADDPLIPNPKWLDVNYFSFSFEAPYLKTSSITFVPHFKMRTNKGYVHSVLYLGTTILEYYDANPENLTVSSLVNINAISANEIDLDFEFTRPGGEIVIGSYKGGYLDVSTEE